MYFNKGMICSVSHLRPGAVLPALEQTVSVTGLSSLWFGQVCAGTALHTLTHALALTVTHTQHVQRTGTRTTLTGAVAPARHVPPEERRENCSNAVQQTSALGCFSVVFTFLAKKPKRFICIICMSHSLRSHS